jgi:hypothetical protein
MRAQQQMKNAAQCFAKGLIRVRRFYTFAGLECLEAAGRLGDRIQD